MTSLTEKKAVLQRKKLQLEGTIKRLEKSLEKTRALLAEISHKRPQKRNAKVVIHKNKNRLEILEFQEKQEWKIAKTEIAIIEKEIKENQKQETKYHKLRIGAGAVLGLMAIITLLTFFFSGLDWSITGLLVGENISVENVSTENGSVEATGFADSANLTVNASLDGVTGAETVVDGTGAPVTDVSANDTGESGLESEIDAAVVAEEKSKEKIPKELKENLDVTRVPAAPSKKTKKPKTLDEIIQETGMRVERSKIKEIRPLTYSSEEIIYQDWKYRQGLNIHRPLIDGLPVTTAVPLDQKDEFTYSASFDGTTMEIEFDTPNIKNSNTKFSQFKIASDTAWKFGYNYKLPSETFTARIRVSSSSPIEITDTYFAAMRSEQLELDFETERRNNYELETLQAGPNIVYVYLTKNFTEEGKKVGDDIVLDPTLTISNTRTELCSTVAQYDLIDVNTGGILQLCEANSTSNYGWVNISVGYFGNFSLDASSRIEGFSNGRNASGGIGGTGVSAVNDVGVQGQDGNNGTAGSQSVNPNGGGGGGGDKAGNNDAAAGAGGAFGGNGGKGGLSALGVANIGGVAYGAFNSVVLKMGSGGGGAGADVGRPGGDGGGGIKIVAGAQGWVGIRGTINVSGSNGSNSVAGTADLAGGGGGSGGHVVLIGGTINLNSAVINANGGGGGLGSGTDSCPGGGGGGGRLYIVYETLQSNGTRFTTNHGFLGGNVSADAACDNPSDSTGPAHGANGTFQMNGSVFFNRMPRVVALAPANLTINDTDATPEFFFNVTDDLYLQSYLNCTVQVQNASGTFNKGTNNTVFNNTLAIITADSSLNDGPYTWWVNCSDGVNPWALGGDNTPEYFDANISVFRNLTINLPDDTTAPTVTNLTPVLNSRFNITQFIEIAANVTDTSGISFVLANITYPNQSTILYNLSNSGTRPNWYNMTFLIPELTGLYNVSIVANDTLNNYNRTEFTNFTVKVGCANITRTTTMDQDVTSAGNCFYIGAPHITLNGTGYTIIYGTAGKGVAINNTGADGNGYDNVTIKNVRTIKGSTTASDNYAIFLQSVMNMTITNTTIMTNGTSDNYGLYLSGGSNDTLIDTNVISTQGSTGNNWGIRLEEGSSRAIIVNNNITSLSRDFVIYDLTVDGVNNSLIYNNTWGEIRWIDNQSQGSFVRNLTLNITNNLGIGLDRNLFIGNNTIAFNTSAFGIDNGGRGRINGTANMTLIGINNTYVTEILMLHNYNLSINFSIVQSGGVKCLTCSNISYIGNTLKFNATGLGVFSANDSTVAATTDSCGNLTASKTLVASVTSTDTCFQIRAANIVLDCAGYTVTYGTAGQGIGVNNSGSLADGFSAGYDNVVIKNCIIEKGSQLGSFNYGIAFVGVTNSTIEYNTIVTNGGGTDNYGIMVRTSSARNRIRNNTIFTNGTTDNYGIEFPASATFNVIENNSIYTNGSVAAANGDTNSWGIRMSSSSDSNQINYNTIYTNGSGQSNYGIVIASLTAFNTTIESNIIYTRGNSSNNRGIRIAQVPNTTIRSNKIFTSGSGSRNFALELADGANYSYVENNNFTVGGSSAVAVGIDINGEAAFNTLINNNITTVDDEEIRDLTNDGIVNYLIYNNSFGEIKWLDNGSGSFQRNLTIDSSLNTFRYSHEIFIGNNTFYLNMTGVILAQASGSTSRINSSANITLYNTNYTNFTNIMRLHNYTANDVFIRSNGINCTTPSCYIIKNASTSNSVYFNVSKAGGSYSANGTRPFTGEAANARPTAAITSIPTNGSSTTNRTGRFGWWNSTDADGDIFSYHLQIDDNARFNNPELNVSAIPTSNANTSATYYFSTTLLTADITYFWRVRANDSGGFGDWSNGATVDGPSDASNLSNFTLNSLLQISFRNEVVAFGELSQDQIENTTDQNPLPFRAENTGNIYFNVTLNATQYFDSVAFPSSNYNFKIRENESASFNLSQSQLQWVFMPKVNSTTHVAELNWRDAFNDFLVDINVTVPNAESSGLKSSNVTFTITSSNLG